MKNKEVTLVVLGLFCIVVVRGQLVLDTIYTNETTNVALFFPSPVQQAVTGHDGFVFSYDREEAGYVGLLQGVEGPNSNLLVITSDGGVYAYILSYAKELLQLNHFVQMEHRIGIERPNAAKVPINSPSHRISGYNEKIIGKLLSQNSKSLARKRKKGMVLRVEDIHYIENDVYLVGAIKNRSGINFEVGYLDVLRINGSKKRRASYQEIQVEVKQTVGLSHTIATGETIRFVLVMPKFVLGDQEQLKLILRELQGNRTLEIIY
ncbi:DUF4138 domain-containing protein [Muricauda sp. TY007]|uniref:DUF4138 domain-containing protein n=1 Tax=Allomuricauda sp. TY007 TaxID=2683200 RepID=UPI0013BEC4FA|nr:DUF4138 domain-containing protein [Muricauda sp. TY007]NDV17660.1 DUF4138 domain-containing protein [Muricauda sp. TY007]